MSKIQTLQKDMQTNVQCRRRSQSEESPDNNVRGYKNNKKAKETARSEKDDGDNSNDENAGRSRFRHRPGRTPRCMRHAAQCLPKSSPRPLCHCNITKTVTGCKPRSGQHASCLLDVPPLLQMRSGRCQNRASECHGTVTFVCGVVISGAF